MWLLGVKSVLTRSPDPPSKGIYFRWTPHPAIVTIGDNGDYISVLLYGVLLIYTRVLTLGP